MMDESTMSLMIGIVIGGCAVFCWHLYVVADQINNLFMEKLKGIEEGIEMSEHNKSVPKPEPEKSKE